MPTIVPITGIKTKSKTPPGVDDADTLKPLLPAENNPPATEEDQQFLERIRIGDVLQKLGLVTHDQFRLALAEQQRTNEPVGEILVRLGMVSEYDLGEALLNQKLSNKNMAEILARMSVKPNHIKAALERVKETGEELAQVMRDFGFLSPEGVARAIAIQSDLEYYAPDEQDEIEIESIHEVNISVPKYNGFVPVNYHADTNTIRVAVTSPANISKAQNLYRRFKAEFVIASEQTAQAIYRKWFSDTEKSFNDALSAYRDIFERSNGAEIEQHPELLRNILGTLLRHASYIGASDIHIHPSEHVGVVKLTIDGVSYIFKSVSRDLYDRMINKIILDSNVKAQDLRRGMKDASIEISQDETAFYDLMERYAFRLELGNSKSGITAVIRILDKQSSAADFNNLGFDRRTRTILKSYLETSSGLVLLTGPTGSGKTTTLYSLLKELDPEQLSIQSIENPVEYRHGLWMQYEIPRATEREEGEEWAKYLKGLLRNAPKVILLGEVRDSQTAGTMIDASNTGHLVFSTLHTNSSVLALSRLLKLHVDPDDLANVLLGILAQRLVRALCIHCKVPDTRESTQKILHYSRHLFLKVFGWNPHMPSEQGCANCSYTGYRGRRMIYELLHITNSVRVLIENHAKPTQIREEAFQPGMTMWDCGLKLVATSITSIHEVKRVASHDFDDLLE